jgi:transcriptional regulator with XRE-family HTH domain
VYNVISEREVKALNVGAAITELRTRRGMSQKELADALFVSRDLVSKWETGVRRPDYPTIEKLASLFGVSPDEIADRNDVIFRELSECVRDGGGISEEDLISVTERFLQSLGEREAGMFLKRYYFLETQDQIAAEYGIKTNHVRSILSKTRKKLRKFVKEAPEWTE